LQRIEQILLGTVGVLVVLTAIGMVLLWPAGDRAPVDDPAPLYDAHVASTEEYDCPEDQGPFAFQRDGPCQIVTVEVTEGPAEGRTFEVDTGVEDYPAFTTGDDLRVGIAGEELGEASHFYVADFARTAPLVWLFVLFVAFVVLIGRTHGARSLLGLAISLVLIVVFVVPAILEGQSPFLVAIVGAFAIMVVTLYLAHGFTVKTTSALVGTAAALGFTALLGALFVAVSQLTGYSSEEANFARFAVEGGLDLRGLILAGLVIGALGVLDDVTVSQASTVFAVHSANPSQSWSEVFVRAMSVGRDHIASVVNTLVLAYVGASIPLIVLFSTGGLPFVDVVNAEIVAEEIVKTLVGSIGLVSAVPLTTALATTVVIRRGEEAPAEPVPAHLAGDVDEEELTDDERTHRRWVELLRDGDPESVPIIPGQEPIVPGEEPPPPGEGDDER
jgi:uncharacterized membrane protein